MRAQFIMVGKVGWQEYLPAVAAVARGFLAHIWVAREIECREYWPSVGF